jgi:hypothetical protein
VRWQVLTDAVQARALQGVEAFFKGDTTLSALFAALPNVYVWCCVVLSGIIWVLHTLSGLYQALPNVYVCACACECAYVYT